VALRGIVDLVRADSAVAEVVARAKGGRRDLLDISAPSALTPVLAAAIADAEAGDRPVILVTATGREAEDLSAALRSLLNPDEVADFPAWETLPHERLSPSSDVVGRRLAVLRRLTHPDPQDPAAGPVRVLVTPVRSLLQPIVKGLGDLVPVVLRDGDEVELGECVRLLVNAGYSRVDLVEKRGQIAVRGGILDVFPPTEEHPVRVEFWGDIVEEVRYFKVADQRSLEIAAHGLYAPPCRELLLTDAVRDRARVLMEQHPELVDVLDRVVEGIYVEGVEAFSPVLADGMELLIDVVPERTVVLLSDPERIRTRAHDLVATSDEFLAASWSAAGGGGKAPIDLGAAAYRGVADVRLRAGALGLAWWGVSPFTTDAELVDDIADPEGADVLTASAQSVEPYRGETDKALADMKAAIARGWRVVVVMPGHGPAARLVEQLSAADIAARVDKGFDAEAEQSLVHVVTGGFEHGFMDEPAKLLVLTESDLLGQKSSMRDASRMPSRRRRTIDPLQLVPGDYVVHEQHGVGKYVEMVQRTVAGATREYLVLEYAAAKRGQPGDRLYVPTDALEQITKYVGGESPSLHRLGGSDWTATKNRARKAVRQIAAELVRLYAARRASKGFAFSPDTPWQRELEDAFPYIETPDQASTIDEVKADMERALPMDRVVAGDVGYGKTEIAVRAAFKATQDGKQVVVLVPTTLLVQQHYATFKERFGSFPVNVRALSRFQSDKEAKEVVAGLTDGTVDVVIGTHRLLTPDIRFKDLGLVIVDEEQRFGVEHKEQLKALRINVDMLAMSATPIPRTLEMSITGIRDMSVIQTPPEERHPVLTFVGPYDEKQVSAAIRRELLREGQVFFVHNRVESINRVAARVAELVPEARIAVAHGQMNEHLLEQVIIDFWDKKFDVLVSTTIVESGLDIPNANTLILDRADMFGLSQLHQLRGRVGRSRERGYAYFLYPPEKPLTETAHERLATIAQHTDLGSGMAVAMKDLEIRGAGNLLGGEQSGHIAEVGFDLYVRLVGEALANFKGEGEREPIEVKVELPIDAHIPHEYVREERLRLEAYRRMAEAQTDGDVDAVAEELLDRYGPLPVPVESLLEVARLRVHARQAGLAEIVIQGKFVRFAPVDLAESRRMRLNRLYPGTTIKAAVRTILVPAPTTAKVGGTPLRGSDLLTWCRALIDSVLVESAITANAPGGTQ
jgi:transcription-repair coupling factor (superfamily II helicase)